MPTTDVLANANTAVVSSGGTTAPASGTSETWTVTTAAPWPLLVTGEVLRVMDELDIGKTSGYELMELTATANGSSVSWTATRGVEGTAPYAHAAAWTVVPVATAGGLAGAFLAIGGGTLTGALASDYGGSATDTVESFALSTDTLPRFTRLANGRTITCQPTAPAFFGTHSSGSVGAGSDSQQTIEMIGNYANLLSLTLGRQNLTDGAGHYCYITAPITFPCTSVTIPVSSTSGIAASGTLNYSDARGQVGTIAYASIVDGTHFGGCTSSGLTTDTDTSARHALYVTDSFGNPTTWLSNPGGLAVSDMVTFRYSGATTNAVNDIAIGFKNGASNAGGTNDSAIRFGNDGNVLAYRSSDGSGNNEFNAQADGHILRWYSTGLSPNTALPLGSTTNPWSKLVVSPGTAAAPPITNATDGTTGLFFTTASGAEVIGMSHAGTETLQFNPALLYPLTDNAYALGSTANRWSNVVAVAHGFGSGSAGAPGIYGNLAADTGLFIKTTTPHTLAISAGGVDVMDFVSTAATLNVPLTVAQTTLGVATIAAATGSQALDFAAKGVYDVTMTGNTSFTFANATVGTSIEVTLRGSHTPTWPTVAWAPAAPTYADAGSGMTFQFWVTSSGEVRGAAIPSGPLAAGGDLSGTFPNPTVARLNGIAAAAYALLASPTFTGTPAGPTAAGGTNTTQLATTAFVTAAVSASTAGVASFNGRTGTVVPISGDYTVAQVTGGAGLASPAFTGTPTAPTASGGTNTTQLATTAFVTAAVSGSTAGVASFNGRTGTVVPVSGDYTVAGVTGAAPLASPAFTGIPTAPTPTSADNSTKIATTAYVQGALTAVPVVTTAFTSNAYTLALSDAGTAQQSSNGATAATITVPLHSSVAFPVGTAINITQSGAGAINIVAAAGVTIWSSVSGGFVSGATGPRVQWSQISLLQTGTNAWVLSGDVG